MMLLAFNGRVRALAQPSFAGCRHFCASPQEIESQLPGMRSLGSAHASVRSGDGLCRRHDRYLASSSYCADYLSTADG
jgi:hypothetical protein